MGEGRDILQWRTSVFMRRLTKPSLLALCLSLPSACTSFAPLPARPVVAAPIPVPAELNYLRLYFSRAGERSIIQYSDAFADSRVPLGYGICVRHGSTENPSSLFPALVLFSSRIPPGGLSQAEDDVRILESAEASAFCAAPPGNLRWKDVPLEG